MLFGSMLWAEYTIDFVAAWALGIVFQYFAIQPMRHLPVGQALVAAIKADTLSIVAFQIGMYAWMALVLLPAIPSPAPDAVRAAVLADDADRHDLRICDKLSNEPLANPRGIKRGDVRGSAGEDRRQCR